MLAKSLLQNTSLSAKEIAFRLGFSDEHYFSNFFKKRTGMRPVEYKKGCHFDP
jgi:YesN/AraC family two-component response regulator